MRKVSPYLYLPLAFALVLTLGLFLGSHMMAPTDFKKTLFKTRDGSFEGMVDVLNLIHQDYVDTIHTDRIANNVIKGLLDELDPHSEFIPAEHFNRMNDPLRGRFDGIGIYFRMIRDTIVVIKPVADGPSEKVGLLPGDRIVEVDGVAVAGKGLHTDSIVGMLKGERQTTVEVGVQRQGVPGVLNYTITRDEIPLYSLDIAYMADDSTGYIKLNKFSATTASEVNDALRQLLRNNMTRLILDLRGNGGGYFSGAIEVAEQFLEKEALIVYTKGKNRPRKESRASGKGMFTRGALVVLIDEFSASASEIVAGAIQDNGRGTIIGRRSFGKGLVQEQIPMQNGAAIRLTVARYFTPAGRSIQRPYHYGNDQDYYLEIAERFRKGHDQKNSKPEESEVFLTAKGDTVYGGGGIYPDIYVPYHAELPNKLAKELVQTGMMFRFAFTYVDNNRQLASTFHDPQEFIRQYEIQEPLINSFKAFLRKNKIPFSTEDFDEAQYLIKTRLKAFIGRNLFDDEVFYPVFHKVDPEFTKAMEHLNS